MAEILNVKNLSVQIDGPKLSLPSKMCRFRSDRASVLRSLASRAAASHLQRFL